MFTVAYSLLNIYGYIFFNISFYFIINTFSVRHLVIIIIIIIIIIIKKSGLATYDFSFR